MNHPEMYILSLPPSTEKGRVRSHGWWKAALFLICFGSSHVCLTLKLGSLILWLEETSFQIWCQRQRNKQPEKEKKRKKKEWLEGDLLEYESWPALLTLPPGGKQTGTTPHSFVPFLATYSIVRRQISHLYCVTHILPPVLLTFHLCLFSVSSSGHNSNITLQCSPHHHSQSPIKAKSLPLLFRHPRAKLQYQHWHM